MLGVDVPSPLLADVQRGLYAHLTWSILPIPIVNYTPVEIVDDRLGTILVTLRGEARDNLLVVDLGDDVRECLPEVSGGTILEVV
jgi:hypothetical protein